MTVHVASAPAGWEFRTNFSKGSGCPMLPSTTTDTAVRITNGWTRVPNSFVENQGALTPAERSLALIVFRRGGDGVSISDRAWERWTGLSIRQKDYAIAGLREKCLRVDGRGNEARFAFDTGAWSTYLRSTAGRFSGGEEKPRTAGRKIAVKAEPGMEVHPDCRATGCSKLCGGSGACESEKKPVTVAPKVEQPVAQTEDAVEALFPKTLAFLISLFSLVGSLFLLRLVQAARLVVPNVTDSQLLEAVEMAWSWKSRTQKSEGMFLFTVPDALRRLQEKQKKLVEFPARAGGGGGPSPLSPEAVERYLTAAADRLQPHTALLGDIAVELRAVAAEIRDGRLSPVEHYGVIESRLQSTAARVVERFMVRASSEQLTLIESQIAAKIESLPAFVKVTADLRLSMRESAVFAFLDAPKFSAFWEAL